MRELNRIRLYQAALEAFENGQAYQRELDIRRALQVAGIPTDPLTGMVLISILADQLADHPRAPLNAMIQGMLNTARTFLEQGKLCRNDNCRAGVDMTKHFESDASRCVWCGEPF